MENLPGGALPGGAISVGLDTLSESMWESAEGLDSNASFTSLLQAFQGSEKGSFKPASLDGAIESDPPPGQAYPYSQDAFNQPNLFTSSQIPNSSPRQTLLEVGAPMINTATDPLLGIAATAQLVGGNAKINFQPAGSPIPSGYTADTGAAYSSTRGFGWVRQDSLSSSTHVPLDVSPNVRDRNRVADKRLDTLIQMQDNNASNPSAVKVPAAWEYALANGKYNVTLSVGDPAYFDSKHSINVEGVNAISLFQPSSTQPFKQANVQVNVADGKLTVDAIGGTNSKINYVDISSAEISSGGGNIQIKTPNSAIVQNRMVFSTVNEERRPPKTLTITNTGSGNLTITGLSFGNGEASTEADFELVNPPTLPFTLTAGESSNLNVQFAPKGGDKFASLNPGDSPTHTKNGEQYDSLIITSNDPDQSRVTVNLAGLNSANYEGNNEPALAEIARTFGFTFDVGKEDNILGGSKTPLGDEVYSPYWLRADTTKPVLLWPLAVYSGRSDNPHNSIRFEAKPGSGGNSGTVYQLAGRKNDDSPTGNEVLGSNNLSGGENQKLLPKILVNGVNTTPTTSTVDFAPTKAFALNRGGAWTDDSKNGTSQLHNWRLYPVGNPTTTTTWVAAVDPGNNPDPSTGKNFDYNDDVYLLVNARPESPPLSSLSYRIDSGSSSAYTDTSGKTWGPDTGFTNGVAENGGTPPPEIANTNDDTLYQTYRGKTTTLNYNFAISSPQKVDLDLHFAELYWGVKADLADGGVGSRIFDLVAEGTTVLKDFDIAAAAGGPRRAIQRAIRGISVTDGTLNLSFRASKDFPSISAISVLPSVS